MKADSLLKEAVVLYRNAGESQRAEQVHNRLLAIQSELSNEMPIITITFDVTNIYNHVKSDMEALFRYYAQLLGSNISTLDGNGIAEDKLLSSVFDDECLND